MLLVSYRAVSRFANCGFGVALARACLFCAMFGGVGLAANYGKEAAFAATAPGMQLAPDASTPDGLVKSVAADVMGTIKGDPSIAGNRNKMFDLMNQKIWPYVDFQRTTRLAMGRSWLAATPEQRAQVVNQFKLLLSYTYASSLANTRDQRVDYKPLRAEPDATDVVVQSQVVGNGQPVAISYRLTKTSEGWRVYDLQVQGVWVVPTYQQRFSEQINRGGIDGLIEYLVKLNQAAAH